MLKVKLVLVSASLSILSVSLVTGCASSAATGAAIGGTTGCAVAMVLEKDPKKRATACLFGVTAGGVAGYLLGRQQDLALAKAAAQQIQASQPGVAAVQMYTQNLAVPLEARAKINNAETIESLDTMVVSVPVSQIQRMDPKAANTLSMVGKFVSDANTNSRVVISAATPQDYDYMVASMKHGYGKPLPPQKVAYQYRALTRGTLASVEVSPAPMTIA